VAKKMFGTAGIRGLTNREITPDMALRIARAFGDRLGNRGRAVVGRDTRYGAEMLSLAATAGLVSAGFDVSDCGVIPTGGLCTLMTRGKYDGGVLITGSHTPPDRIGIICLLPDGAYIPDGIAREVEERYEALDRSRSDVPPEHVGRFAPEPEPIPRYLASLVESVDRERIAARRFRVVVDPVNGAASEVFPELLRRLGCEVHVIHGTPGPVFARPSEPRAPVLGAARAKVLEVGADLGCCTDVDADRVLFVDEQGRVLSEDLVGALFADHLFGRGGGTCVVPINSSGVIEWLAARSGFTLVDCPPGQPATVEVVKRHRADYAYEESGKYYFCRRALWCDGLFAAARLLEILAAAGKPLSALAAPYPTFHQVKHTVHCDDAIKEPAMARVFRMMEGELLDGRRKDVTLDGFKRVFQDDAWLLIRKSGTEPLIRVYSDAMSPERAQDLVRQGKDLLGRAMRSASA